MDLEDIQQIIKAFEKAKISKLSLKKDGFEISLEKEKKQSVVEVHKETPMHYREMAPVHHLPPHADHYPREEQKLTSSKPEEKALYITSPMVGTFYDSPSPEDSAFVKVGDRVEEHTIVCIIEAMKVMNEVKAGMKGVIKEVLVENGHPLEFGSKIFRIEAS